MKNWNIHAISAIYIAQLILIVVQCCSKILVIMNEIRDSQCNSMHSFYARRSLNYKDFCYSRLIKQEGISYSPDPRTLFWILFYEFLILQSEGFYELFVFLSNKSLFRNLEFVSGSSEPLRNLKTWNWLWKLMIKTMT